MARHRGRFFVLAWSALMGLLATELHAETIRITISGPGFTIDATPYLTPNPTSPSHGITLTDAAGLNAALGKDGSAFQINSLGGSSNFGGSTALGTLTLGGNLTTLPSGTTSFTITETEAGFAAPAGLSGTLSSSTSGTFTTAFGGWHSAFSSFNSLSTTPVTLTPTTDNSSPPSVTHTMGMAPVPTLYTLTNTITFSLPLASTSSPSVPTDSFGVGAVVTAVVPEPTSIVMLSTGLPLTLVFMGLFRRRRRQVA